MMNSCPCTDKGPSRHRTRSLQEVDMCGSRRMMLFNVIIVTLLLSSSRILHVLAPLCLLIGIQLYSLITHCRIISTLQFADSVSYRMKCVGCQFRVLIIRSESCRVKLQIPTKLKAILDYIFLKS